MADAEHADIDVHEVDVAVIQDPGFWLRAPGSRVQAFCDALASLYL